jgi:hypothetical protein
VVQTKQGKLEVSMSEEWRDIPGYEGFYQASSLGRIRSLPYTYEALDRWGNILSYRHKGKILSTYSSPRGYLSVYLRDKTGKRVNRLVCSAFKGEPPFPDAVARHLDDNKSNNRADNLEWGTPKDNTEDALRNNVHPVGEKNGLAKLTEAQVLEIRSRYCPKKGNGVLLAQEFGVHNTIIYEIVKRKTWKHI